MRLICPNCGAQYEVDVQVIPDGGRDVQCSNCGHTWFQRPADQDPGLAEELESPPHEGVAPADEQFSAEEIAPDRHADYDPAEAAEFFDDAGDATVPTGEDQDEIFGEEDVAADPQSEPAEPKLQRRELDQGVLDILKEEAARETAARQSETLESQPDLGLDESQSSGSESRGLRERMARLRGVEEAGGAAGAAAASGRRRDLLPDIEEINSTLRADEPTGDYEEAPVATGQRRGGFGLGFWPVVVVIALLIGLYLLAALIAAKVPALEGGLTAYVDTVNGLRDWLDLAMQGAVAKLTLLLDQLNSGG
ncbi:zinc-ribbon domain-containing protein [Aliiroseovarius sp. PTFE2010]|uniref:zinc-ribbon domain-containing protein n=1 Tax=Aliiroseovarius sp. PTFE2010 TaxID=3417190 RepID=UPI003CF394BC